MRFRLHRIAFTADIEKMYLHVWLREEDRDLQRIIWRSDPTKPLIDYQLTTVTFGVNSSPFLAVATIQHHAKNAKERYPQASELILSDLYMDDLSSGCDDLETATQIQKQTTQILADAGFPLRKWMSNNEELMERIPENQKEGAASEDGCISTLGLRWHHSCDKLSFKANTKDSSSKITKRAILSQITAIYDPLGLLAPITIYNKILMQQIWREKTDWDDSVSTEIASKWNAFKQQIGIVEKIKVNRWINYTQGAWVELHAFGDASEAAMGACVYMKTIQDNEVHVNLIAAKTKVAPIKKITLPKLELCAAVLVCKLVAQVKRALKIKIMDTHYYSDSEITLAWIKGDPNKWKTFVANRVSRINELSQQSHWHYINTKANPADLASRGVLPADLKESKLWWHGPSVLLNELNCAPEKMETKHFETELEKKKIKTTVLHTTVNNNIDMNIINKFSSFNRATRAIAYCRKYINELRKRKTLKTILSGKETIKEMCNKQFLSVEELDTTKYDVIRACQENYFGKEMQKLRNKECLPKDSRLKPLYPFIDQHNLLRMGGRLQHSEFTFNKKHPIIIPYGCEISKAIIADAHKQTFHGGNQVTLNQIRHEYWILSAKRAVKTFINNCVTCHRFRNEKSCQLMGSLPATRTKTVKKHSSIPEQICVDRSTTKQ